MKRTFGSSDDDNCEHKGTGYLQYCGCLSLLHAHDQAKRPSRQTDPNAWQKVMLKQTTDLLRKAFGRDLISSLQKFEASQQKQADAFLDAEIHSGNFNTGGHPDSDGGIPSDAFGDW